VYFFLQYDLAAGARDRWSIECREERQSCPVGSRDEQSALSSRRPMLLTRCGCFSRSQVVTTSADQTQRRFLARRQLGLAFSFCLSFITCLSILSAITDHLGKNKIITKRYRRTLQRKSWADSDKLGCGP